MTTTTTSALADAGEKLLDEIRDIIREPSIDQNAVESAVAAFKAAAGDIDITAVRYAIGTINGKHKQGYEFRDAQTASRMAAQNLWQLASALDNLTVPFDQAAELAAAEQELTQRERDQKQALTELERAVQAGDVDKVMALRGEVEVKHPRRIAEARTAVLELRIEQERGRADAAAARAREFAALSTEASEEHKAAAARLARAAEDAALANLAYGEMSRVAREANTGVSALERELGELKTSHEQEMRARLRRIAGLPESGAPASGQQVEPDYDSPIVEVMQPPLIGEPTVLSPGTARHIGAPVANFSPSAVGNL